MDCEKVMAFLKGLFSYLFRAEPVNRHDLSRQAASIDESHGIQADLTYQSIIRNHHGNCTEKNLQTWYENKLNNLYGSSTY